MIPKTRLNKLFVLRLGSASVDRFCDRFCPTADGAPPSEPVALAAASSSSSSSSPNASSDSDSEALSPLRLFPFTGESTLTIVGAAAA